MAVKFEQLGLRSFDELINNYPRRYDDYSRLTAIRAIKPGPVSIKAVISSVAGRYVRRGMHVTEAVASDETGSVRLVWFNQPYRAASLRQGAVYYISGQFELNRQRLSIMNPAAELVSTFPLNAARIVPIYRESKQLKSAAIRKAVRQVLETAELPETLPAWIIRSRKLLSRDKAVWNMHFPASAAQLDSARRRLGFEEVFELTLAALLNKAEYQQTTALSIPFDEQLAKSFVSHLDFRLTDAQRKVIWQIYKDMQSTVPMNRLIEGDVGSGKTVVAVMAAIMAIKQGFQVALMAPTEILARQHADTIYQLLQPLGLADHVTLLVGSSKPATKHFLRQHIEQGTARFVIGTHALIQDSVAMPNLGLVIVDEQHRFGVEQRKKLQAKAGLMPHVLHMTATPIPRSLALTLYGELDISIIDSKPPGRTPVITRLCSPNSRQTLYREIDDQLDAGRQLFVVCPLIQDSAALEARSAETVYRELCDGHFKQRRIGLLHGKMKAPEKAAVMEQFARHRLDILVATTVIEVGVNVPNATMLLLEDADRFGLAQIHQLRGRVGRSHYQGYAYLMLSDSRAPSKRLRALEQSNDGFQLAELDLRLRGPGAIYGTMQHGQLDLRVANLSDSKLIANARAAAREFIDRNEDLVQYSHLAARVSRLRTVTNLN